jgi:protein-S-isoprenylcysteine O-methyltransferase Ste14
MRTLVRAAVWAAPAVLVYTVLLPLAAIQVDRRLALTSLPEWVKWPALALLAAGAGVSLWTIWLFAVMGHGTPNPLAPPQRLVTKGPYRCTRNPMMLGAWAVGIGLALVLRSPTLLVLLVLVIALGVAYVRLIEEPGMRERFGAAYSQYERNTPRWLRLSRGCTRAR